MKMKRTPGSCSLLLLVTSLVLVAGVEASEGDSDPVYKSCLEQCQKTGCVGDKCFQHCKFSFDGKAIDGPWYRQEPLYLQWKQWDCRSDCQYHCMLTTEKERRKLDAKPAKYHGKWPLHRIYGIEEPVSVALSVLNLAMQFHGWLTFFILVYYKLPLRPNKTPFYEYTGLWHIYGILAMNYWFWSAALHSRDVELTQKLHYSSAAALGCFGLLVAILRAFSVRDEAARVMVTAPLVAFTTTHILYLNFFKLDYGLNTKVCTGMYIAQLVIAGFWAAIGKHPSRWKLCAYIVLGSLAKLLDLTDFSPYKGFVDARAVSHAVSIPLTLVCWSFARDDAEFRTSALVKKVK